MLQNAVEAIPELRQVKSNAELQATIHKRDISFSEYDSLLQSSAAQYDSSMSSAKKTRNVYMSNISEHPDEDDFDDKEEQSYDIDTPIDTIQANMSRSHSTFPSSNTRLPQDKWNHLSDDERKTWNSLSREAKAIILGINSKPTKSPPPRQSMLHDMSAVDFLSLLQETSSHDPTHTDSSQDVEDKNILINAAASKASVSPADIRRVLSSQKNNNGMQDNNGGEIDINGSRYRKVNTHNLYTVSEHKHTHNASLVDRGANGGIAGNDVRLVPDFSMSPHKTVNIMGIDNHQLTSIPIVSVGGVSTSQHGPVILIFHQYAHYGKGKSIHSPIQLESFHNEVNDKSTKIGGGQYIKTNDGYTFPLDICDGLPYLSMRPFTDQEWKDLPHVIMTSDTDWNPNILDNTISTTNTWIPTTRQ